MRHDHHERRCHPGGFGGRFGRWRGGYGRDDGDGMGGRFGHGRRRLFDADSLRLILLKLMSDAPRHGYDLIREIESLSGGGYAPSPGVVYPSLTLLTDMGLAVEQAGEGSRKLYATTEQGAAHLAANQEPLDAAMARLAALAQQAERVDAAPIRRAMMNLRIALRNRLGAEGVDEETMLGVAALIDEAAGKIERLK